MELVDHSGETVVTWRDPGGQNISSGGDFIIARQDMTQRVDYSLEFNPLKVSHRGEYVCDISIPNVGFYDSRSVSIEVTPGITNTNPYNIMLRDALSLLQAS